MYDFNTDTVTYKDHKIENFFGNFPQQSHIKDYVKNNLILLCVGGSHAYGLDTESSDLDIRGIFKDNINQILGYEKIEQLEYASKDITIYSLTKAFKLIIEQNPNMQELLWIDEEEILYATDEYWFLRSERHLFLSKLAYNKYSGYAISQLKRIKGHNKWLNKEQAGKFDKKPHIEDYVIFIDKKRGEVEKYRLKSRQFYFMKVKDEIYNVFWTGGIANFPLINEGNNFIPIQETHPSGSFHYYGVIWFNKSQFKKDLEEYNGWENWKKNRNPDRHILEEKFGYDCKHAMHTFRLLNMGIEILNEKYVNVKRPDRELLMAIRNGEFEFEDIVRDAERLERVVMKEAYKNSELPKSVPNQMYVFYVKQILSLS